MAIERNYWVTNHIDQGFNGGPARIWDFTDINNPVFRFIGDFGFGFWRGPYTVQLVNGSVITAHVWSIQPYVTLQNGAEGWLIALRNTAGALPQATQLLQSPWPYTAVPFDNHPSMVQNCVIGGAPSYFTVQYGIVDHDDGIDPPPGDALTNFYRHFEVYNTDWGMDAGRMIGLTVRPYTFTRNDGQTETVRDEPISRPKLTSGDAAKFYFDSDFGGSNTDVFTIEGYEMNVVDGSFEIDGPWLRIFYKDLDIASASQSWDTSITFRRKVPLIINPVDYSQAFRWSRSDTIVTGGVLNTNWEVTAGDLADMVSKGWTGASLTFLMNTNSLGSLDADELFSVGYRGGDRTSGMKVVPIQDADDASTVRSESAWTNATIGAGTTQLRLVGNGSAVDQSTLTYFWQFSGLNEPFNPLDVLVSGGTYWPEGSPPTLPEYGSLKEYGEANNITVPTTVEIDMNYTTLWSAPYTDVLAPLNSKPLFSQLDWGTVSEYPTATKTEVFHTISAFNELQEFPRWLDTETSDAAEAYTAHLLLPVSMQHTAETYEEHYDSIYCFEYTTDGVTAGGSWVRVRNDGEFAPDAVLTTTEDHDFLVFVPDQIADYLDTQVPGWSVTLGSTVLNTSTRKVFYESSSEILTFSGTGFTINPTVSWGPGDVPVTDPDSLPCICGVRFFDSIRVLDTHEYITGPDYDPGSDTDTWGQFGPVTSYERVISSRQTMLDDFNSYFRSHLGAVPGDDLDNDPPDGGDP